MVAVRVADGMSSDNANVDSTSKTSLTSNAFDDVNKVASWKGTRVDFRFLDPLPTSRNTKKAAELAQFFIALLSQCTTSDLFLRRAYLKSADTTCDWYMFAEQKSGAETCIERDGKNGYCNCYVPMMSSVGERCLGLEDLTTLCHDVLTLQASCSQPAIRAICSQLEFPDTPRAALVGSGGFLLVCFLPIFALWYRGFFHNLNRPSAKKARIQRVEDADDAML